MKKIKVIFGILLIAGLFSLQLQAAQYNVSGTVKYENGVPAPGLGVKAFNQSLNASTLLGQTSTNGSGFYSIGYSSPGNVNLVIRIYGRDGGLVYESPATMNAQQSASVDVTLLAVSKGLNRLPNQNSNLQGLQNTRNSPQFNLPPPRSQNTGPQGIRLP